jgi:tetrahydromethanopterin S-methyltransferase subunit D
MKAADARYLFIGGIVGGVIGGIIGVMNYRKIRRMATEVIKQIEEINE